ncbi:TetR/AcrR family transcriptional regulator [Demequina muriae]|uniref:TetR/AcrR family transcriptional regulator n=1 Tax=Demequina muriae TaxID=3051664 RepID=A0ABT8GEL9_9MICO|nr:TetR/AcrR family transcriptional regulator [Demequina sp. EGI L300058]MDN4479879.1 TetR/AcrR family transcriptional regulator [Demequina sp. EGI L300058]
MDARIARTRRRLQEALFDLAHEQGLDHVSISAIAKRAGVNRTTFYQHYADKETLLADALDLVAQEAGAELHGINEWSTEPPAPLVTFLTHIDAHAELYRRVFSEPGSGAVLARLRHHVNDAVSASAATVVERDRDVPLDVIAAGVTGSIIGVIGAWLDHDPRAPVDDAALWVWRIIMGPPDAYATR